MGDNTVGASQVSVDNYKCSIKKIVISTTWKGPTSEIPETVSSTVFNIQSPSNGKTIYFISSPEGKKATLKTARNEGKCPRDNHKKYVVSWENQKKEEVIKNVEDLIIKCYKIDGPVEPFKYLSLPIPTLKNYSTTFKYISCTEGPIQYKIVSYPDISFTVEFSIGTEAKKNINKSSPFEKKTSALKRVPSQLQTINNKSLGTQLKFSPSLTASTTFNGDKDEIELKINFDSEEEIVQLKYKHDSKEIQLGSKFIQDIKGNFIKISDLIKLIVKICEIDFLKELKDFDSSSLVKGYKPYKLNLASPNVLFSLSGKYHVSRDLTRIGKYIDLGIACEPLIKISFTVDLLFLILTGVSAGSATGFYVMLKNLDKVLGKILGKSYKKKYKDTEPFTADIYFNFIISGAINGGIHWIIDTTEKEDPNSHAGAIEGVLKADLEAGAKCKLDIFIIAVEGEVSASGSTGIKIKFGSENHILQGKGVSLLLEGYFLGLKLKYCVTGKVGLMKTTSYGGNLLDGNPTLLGKSKLFSQKWTFLS